MKRFVAFAFLAGWLAASGVVAQTLLPVQVSVGKKETVSRVVKKKASVTHERGGQMHSPEIAERTQKIALTIKLLNMAPSHLSGAHVNYTVIARGRTVSDLKIAKDGKTQVDLAAMRPTSIELEPVSFLMEETVFRYGAFSNKNTQDGDQYYGVYVLVEHGDRKFEFADPKDLVAAVKRLKPSSSEEPAPDGAAARTTQARNFYLDEKPFDKLSDKKTSDWGVLALATSTKWKHGETEHFIIHFFANADAIARRCEKFYADTREFFGFRHDLMGALKSHVFAFHDPADWKSFRRQVKLSDTTGGVARSHEFFYLSVNSDKQFDALAHVQAHEMTHLVFNRFFNGRVPLWLNEGVAEYFGLKKIADITTFRTYVGKAKPFPLDKLFAAEKYPEQEQSLRSFYAESAIVLDFLTQTSERRALLPKFIDAMIAKNDADAALKLYGFNARADFEKAYERHRGQFPKH